MNSLDVRDAYFTIPIHEHSIKFEFHKITYTFHALLQSFKTSLRVFIKIMKPALAHFRLQAYMLTFTLMIYTFRAPPYAKSMYSTLNRSFNF